MKLLSDKEIKELVEKYPLYSQDGNREAIALYHFFIGSADWYVMEGSIEGQTQDGEDNITLYGLVKMQEVELGYFNLNEMERLTFPQRVVDQHGRELAKIQVQIERDKYFKPTKIKDLKGEAIEEYLASFGWI